MNAAIWPRSDGPFGNCIYAVLFVELVDNDQRLCPACWSELDSDDECSQQEWTPTGRWHALRADEIATALEALVSAPKQTS